jgi:hypothetical protein
MKSSGAGRERLDPAPSHLVEEESLRFMLVLEADNRVIRVTDDDHVAGRLAAPAVGPKIVQDGRDEP